MQANHNLAKSVDTSCSRGIHTMLFDLDGTLYPGSSGYEQSCKRRIIQFMVDDLGVKSEEHARHLLSLPEFNEHNLMLHGLQKGLQFKFDEENYWFKMRGDPSEYLEPNIDALEVCCALPQITKFVFTNCAERQASETLCTLGLANQFKSIYGANFSGDTAKPDPLAFKKVIAHAGIEPEKTIFFDDRVENLKSASTFGFVTVLVADELQEDTTYIPDAVVSSISLESMQRTFPSLFSLNSAPQSPLSRIF